MAMTLTRWDPFGIDFHDRWRRLLEIGAEPEGWLRVEEIRENGDLVVRAELPGIDPDKDVDVSVSEGVLHIGAEREERTESKEKDAYRSEFRYGHFSRDIVLPRGMATDAVKAKYNDGILEVRIPWPKETDAEPTKVPVTRS